ncbi:hypothetical protein ACOU9P_002264 [Enterococcus faecium]
MKIDKRRTKENVAKLKQYVCWIDEYFYNLDKVKVTLETTKVVLEHTDTGCRVEDTDIVERFTNKNSDIVRNTKDYAIRDAKRLGQELNTIVKNYKVMNSKSESDELLLESYKIVIKNKIVDILNKENNGIREFVRIYNDYRQITVSDDFKATILYAYKGFKSQSNLDFKPFVEALIENDIKGVDLIYGDITEVDKYISSALKMDIRKNIVKGAGDIIANICTYEDEFIRTNPKHSSKGNLNGISVVRFTLKDNLKDTINNCYVVDLFLDNYKTFADFEKDYIDKLAIYKKQKDDLKKLMQLKPDSFKYLFVELDKKTEKDNISVDYKKTTLPYFKIDNGYVVLDYDIYVKDRDIVIKADLYTKYATPFLKYNHDEALKAVKDLIAEYYVLAQY